MHYMVRGLCLHCLQWWYNVTGDTGIGEFRYMPYFCWGQTCSRCMELPL